MKTINAFFSAVFLALLCAFRCLGMEQESPFFKILANGFEKHAQVLERKKNSSEIPISVTTASGDTITIRLDPKDTITLLKAHLAKKLNMNAYQIRLRFAGLVLGRDKNPVAEQLQGSPLFEFRGLETALMYYGIQKESQIWMEVRLKAKRKSFSSGGGRKAKQASCRTERNQA